MGHAWALQIGKRRLYPLKLQSNLYLISTLEEQLYQNWNFSGADQPGMGSRSKYMAEDKNLFGYPYLKQFLLDRLLSLWQYLPSQNFPQSKGTPLVLFLEGN